MSDALAIYLACMTLCAVTFTVLFAPDWLDWLRRCYRRFF